MSDIPTKNIPCKVLGRTVYYSAPSRIEDVEARTEKGAVLAGYYQQYNFHDRGPALKQGYARKLEAFLAEKGISDRQAAKPELNDDGSPKVDAKGNPRVKYTESEKTFHQRVFSAGHISIEDVDRLLNEVNDEIGAWAPGETRVSKPSKAFYDLADEAMRRINDVDKGASNRERFTANILSKLGVSFEDAFGEVNRDNVARAYQALDEKAREKAKAEALAAFEEDEDGSGDE